MFVAGMATSGRTTTGFIYSGEFFAPRWRIWYGTFFVALSAWTGLFITLYFDFIDKHYKRVCYFGLVQSVLGLIGAILFVPESPLWQLRKGKIL